MLMQLFSSPERKREKFEKTVRKEVQSAGLPFVRTDIHRIDSEDSDAPLPSGASPVQLTHLQQFVIAEEPRMHICAFWTEGERLMSEMFAVVQLQASSTAVLARDPAVNWSRGLWLGETGRKDPVAQTVSSAVGPLAEKVEWNWEKGIRKVGLLWGIQLVVLDPQRGLLCAQTADISSGLGYNCGVEWFSSLCESVRGIEATGPVKSNKRFCFVPRSMGIMAREGIDLTGATKMDLFG
ncbi:MAG: hypothetical protein U5N86_12050 [Planctomycetota bacterium]|nr:hypothetical protein [Planctomycetota bacterium]